MKIMIAVLLELILAGCASSPVLDHRAPITDSSAGYTADQATNNKVEPHPDPKKSDTIEIQSPNLIPGIEVNDLSAASLEQHKQSIYFDYDVINFKPEFMKVIQQQAEFILAHKNDRVVIQGNADERGSEEYNLVLGQQRANSVRKSLEILGVPSGQIDTRSFGDQIPRLTCHEEKCWQENRRADIIHTLAQ